MFKVAICCGALPVLRIPPRCSLAPEAVSHQRRIYTVVLGQVPRKRQPYLTLMTEASPSYTVQSPACIFLVRPLRTPFGRYVLLLSNRVLQKIALGIKPRSNKRVVKLAQHVLSRRGWLQTL